MLKILNNKCNNFIQLKENEYNAYLGNVRWFRIRKGGKGWWRGAAKLSEKWGETAESIYTHFNRVNYMNVLHLNFVI